MTDPDLLKVDLNEILVRGEADFLALRGARIFITGGTGFVGSWLLESLTSANRRLSLGIKAVVLTRDPRAFAAAAPHLAADPALHLLAGDVRDVDESVGAFDAIVHAATTASAKVNESSPNLMVDTIVDGTRCVLGLARKSGEIPLLLTSSGAVYGRQPPTLDLVDESYRGAPDQLDPRNAYHEAKRLAELSCAIATANAGVRAKIARLFAFVGPHLPLDRHFAIGNFIRDAMAGRAIVISGDGTPVRSYLYAADMTTWLWRILVRGAASRAYNVGSERTISIRKAAEAVAAEVQPRAALEVRGAVDRNRLPERYACATARARDELNLAEWTTLDVALRRTIGWHHARNKSTSP